GIAQKSLEWILSFDSVVCDNSQLYLDDLIIFATDNAQIIDLIKRMCKLFRKFNVKLNATKSRFFLEKCEYLGQIWTSTGVQPSEKSIKKLLHLKPPTDRKSLQTPLGVLNWHREFVPRFSILASGMQQLLKKDVKFEWTEKHQADLDEIIGH